MFRKRAQRKPPGFIPFLVKKKQVFNIFFILNTCLKE